MLKDLRVRQAINMSIDRETMIKSLYGDVAEHLNGMMVRKSSLGWNPNLKEYPYGPGQSQGADEGRRRGGSERPLDRPE